MKKLTYILSLLFLVSVGFISCSSDDNDDSVIDYAGLPANAQNFVETHFPGVTSNYVTRENVPDSDGTLYEVHLSNGFDIDFDSEGNWTGIDGNYQILPNSVIALLPVNILNYLSVNYPDASVIEMEKKPYGYKVELNTNVDLRFDSNGNFLGIDY